MQDLDIMITERIFDRYFKDKVKPNFKIELLTQIKWLIFNISMNAMTIDEAREYLFNYLKTIFEDMFTDDEYENIINEILRILKIEELRTKARSRRLARRFEHRF